MNKPLANGFYGWTWWLVNRGESQGILRRPDLRSPNRRASHRYAAPADHQYPEYLGEFYDIQKKTKDTLQAWAAIAAGELRTPESVACPAEVFNSFGYLDQAVKEIGDMCKRKPPVSSMLSV